jgi:hypothetical protein
MPRISKVHVCEGGCGGKVDNDTFLGRGGSAPVRACQAKTCKDYGKPFHFKLYCEECGALFEPGTTHECAKKQ